MAQRSGLFDSTEIVETIDGYPRGNRAETADFFAKYFSNFISNGVFAKPTTNFQVMSSGGMSVTIRPGSCFINGYMAWDTESETMTFSTASAAHRYVLVQRLYIPDGAITKTWLTDPDMTEVPVRTVTTHDLVIATVAVPANAREVTDSMITDHRFDTELCGIVHGVVDQLDTSDIANQLNTAVSEYVAAAENSLVTWEGTFDQWFDAVKGQLSGDAATALEANKTARMYAVCETAADTSAKVAALDGYYLAPGQTVYVRFVNAVPGGATLNVNGTGDIPMYNRGQAVKNADIPEGATAAMVYTGERYDLLNAVVSAAGVKYVTASGTSAITVTTSDGQPVELKDGDRFSIDFVNEATAGATLNINGIGAYPIIDNYTGAAIVKGDIPADYIGDIMFEDGKFLLLNALRVSGTPTGSAFFTQNGTFTVPNFVTAIKVSACAAGISPYAGEGIVDQIFNVTPGQIIELTIGSGNTVIGDLITLIAGTKASSTPTTKLGYAAGYGGGASSSNVGGYGGFFGFGGGAGGYATSTASARRGGGGGGGIAGDGSAGTASAGGAGGGSTGGKGGVSTTSHDTKTGGNDALSGKIIYSGGNGSTGGGGGSIYGAGGGGGAFSGSSPVFGGGGGAGGYGAGGGTGYAKGAPSNGMVLIEWGGTVA